MKARWPIVAALAVLAALAALFAFGPALVEASMNRIDGKPLRPVSERAKALHRTLTIVDLHSDSLLWKRDLLSDGLRGHMDLPRLERGNVALQVFSSVTRTPKGQNYDANGGDTDNVTPLVFAQAQPPRTWTSLYRRSLYHAAKLRDAEARSGGRMRIVRSENDVVDLLGARGPAPKTCDPKTPHDLHHNCPPPRPTGAMLSIEGLHNLEGRLDRLDRLHARGFRMASLTHFFDNDLAGSMHGFDKGGLTPKGREAVRRMERLGMIVDVAHCSHACVADILAMARRPVVSSHGGVQATCKVNRNLTDDEIRGVARTGGVIGIGYWEGAVCSTDPRSVAAAMKHVRDLVGIDTVALGSDYDGATTVRFDTAKLAQVTQALIDAGFTDEDIRKAMGMNALRVLGAGIAPQGTAPKAAP